MSSGVLRLLLNKETYERAGLVGTPSGTTGTKKAQNPLECVAASSDWSSSMLTLAVVELSLRSPSMLHGKKAFERVVWAFKHVLTRPVSWLFCDLDPKGVVDADLAS